jgi:hypothetical protein
MKNITLFFSVAILTLVGISAAEAQSIKWHPGHYMTMANGASQAQHFSHIDEIGKEPAIKGVQVRIWWYELEPSKGIYDFSKIDAYLNRLKSQSAEKRLVVRIMDRAFSTTSRARIVPDYLLSDPQYNGGVVRTKNGYAARLWEKPVMDRLIALYQAIGTRYDSDNYFEGLQSGETTLGLNGSKPPGYSVTTLAQQYKRFAAEARRTMPRTNLFFATNWLGPDEVMGSLVQSFVEPAVGVGGPNTQPDNPTQGQRVWIGQMGADFRGTLAISSSVESTELGGSHGDFTPKQIYDFAYNTLRVNYLFWSRNTWNGDAGQQWQTGILPFLRTNPPTRAGCPTSYGLCATN